MAVKQLRQSIQQLDDEAVRDFDAEVKFMRTLRHVNGKQDGVLDSGLFAHC